jgi:hypothetical protein
MPLVIARETKFEVKNFVSRSVGAGLVVEYSYGFLSS